MAKRWLTAAGVVAVAASASAVAVVLDDAAGLPELLFGTVMFSLLLGVLLAVWQSGRAVRVQRRTAEVALRKRPEQVAAAAVAAERARLSDDIDASVRGSLRNVSALVEQAESEPDPRPRLRDIQAEARRAGTELHRQLGLLREETALTSDPARAPAPVGDHGARAPLSTSPHPAPTRADAWVAGTLVALALGEGTLWTVLEDRSMTWLSLLLTGLAAVTVLGRRVAPAGSASAMAAILLVGAASGHDVHDGIWMILVGGIHVWALTSRGRGWRCWVALALVFGAVVVSRLAYEPDNVGVNVLTLTVAAVVGWVVGRSDRAAQHHRRVSQERHRTLEEAAETAVQAERSSIARELHDLVSHAVAVVAVQAAAAEMSWETDRSAAGRALEAVRSTAAETLSELERLRPGFTELRREWQDVEQLVLRMRAAGLQVDLTVSGSPAEECVGTVYRVVQESLTNVLRHAPDASATVRVTGADDAVELEVVDRGPSAAPVTARRGYGLVGLHDRVVQAGGTFSAGALPDASGFRVQAVVPRRRAVEPA